MPLRILLVTQSPAWGGAEVTILALASELARRGHAVTLAQLGPPLFERAATALGAPISVVTLPQRLGRSGFLQWCEVFQAHPADVCLLSKGSFDRRGVAFDLAARIAYPRYVLFEHHPAPAPDPRGSRHYFGILPGLGLWWRRRDGGLWIHSRSADRIAAVSDTVANRVIESYGYPRDRTVTVHCGVNTDRFRFDPAARQRLRAALDVPESAFVFGAIGRLDANKRFDVAIREFADIAHRYPDRELRFMLGGVGPERARLLEAAASAGIADRCVLAGEVEHSYELLSALDCFVMVSRVEGLGIALLEAMACERVCVATNSGGPAEILTDPSLGWLVPNDDADALGGALEAVVALSCEARAALGRRARAHVQNHFDARRQTERLADLVDGAQPN